jgi:chemotaxis protein MotB
MFWVKRLKESSDTDSSWLLSYGDLVTLLLAIFVMISSMSDLRPSDRFAHVRNGMRLAFGFAASGTAVVPTAASRQPPTLLQRLEQAGFAARSNVQLVGPDDEILAPCDVLAGADGQVTLRIAGHACFSPASAALAPVARKALERLVVFLADGTSRIEIRGHADEGSLPPAALFRDGLDLSYARARAVAETLTRGGLDARRVFITAWADHDPLSDAKTASTVHPAEPEGMDRRIEIVVHAAKPGGQTNNIAGKDRKSNG